MNSVPRKLLPPPSRIRWGSMQIRRLIGNRPDAPRRSPHAPRAEGQHAPPARARGGPWRRPSILVAPEGLVFKENSQGGTLGAAILPNGEQGVAREEVADHRPGRPRAGVLHEGARHDRGLPPSLARAQPDFG